MEKRGDINPQYTPVHLEPGLKQVRPNPRPVAEIEPEQIAELEKQSVARRIADHLAKSQIINNLD